jgi:hypothetical protein
MALRVSAGIADVRYLWRRSHWFLREELGNVTRRR